MKQLLHLIASPRSARSQSRDLSNHFVTRWTASFPNCRVVTRDLRETPLPHVTENWIAADFTPDEARTPAQHNELHLAETLLDELIAADALVIGTPFYNYGLPSALSAWLAHIVLVNRAFSVTEEGLVPLLNDPKPIWVCVASGISGYQPGGPLGFQNTLEPQLRHTFGFIGLKQLQFFYAGGDVSGTMEAEKSRALAEIDAALAVFPGS